MKLHEIVKTPHPSTKVDTSKLKPWQYKTKAECIDWMKRNHLEDSLIFNDHDFAFHDKGDGTLRLGIYGSKDVYVEHEGWYYLPVRFQTIGSLELRVNERPLGSFEGLPTVIFSKLFVKGLDKVKSWKGFPKTIMTFLQLDGTDLNSLNLADHAITNMRLITDAKEGVDFTNIAGLPRKLVDVDILSCGSIQGLAQQCPNLRALGLHFTKPISLIDLMDCNHLQDITAAESGDGEKVCDMIEEALISNKSKSQVTEDLFNAGLKDWI